ncbi:hypothetical protein MMC30_003234 [Trapelia coarctata]|nr:hypothetical protein [Trapelia coarctata]
MLQRQTSSAKNTIWHPVDERTFFSNVKRVSYASWKYPGTFQVFDRKLPTTFSARSPSYSLPLEIEHQLTNDLAFITAAYEGAEFVSATTVSEHAQSTGMTLTVASNAGVPNQVEAALADICRELHRRSQNEAGRRDCLESIFDTVIRLHIQRIHGRLQSKYWKPPDHLPGRPREPLGEKLYQSLRAQSGAGAGRNTEISKILTASEDFRESVNRLKGEEDIDGLKQVVKAASRLSGPQLSFTDRISGLRLLTNLEPKLPMTVDKVGRYWKSCERMVKMASSQTYGHLFRGMQIIALKPYEARMVLGKERHTHAEIQMVTYLRLHPRVLKPRVIGISKATCYLCNLFLSHHPQYLVSATHGIIFESWTIPDLDAYSKKDRIELRRVVASMNQKLIKQAKKKSRIPAPFQSGIFHPPPQLSASPASSIATILSRLREETIRGGPPLDPLTRRRFQGALNTTQGAHAGPYSKIGQSSIARPAAHTGSVSRMAASYPNSTSQPSLAPHSSSSEFPASTPCPSPRIANDLRSLLKELEVPEAPEAPRILSSNLDLRLEDLTPERQDWLEVRGMRLGFELESVGSGNRVYSRQNPLGTAFIRRIFETEIPVGLNVIDVQGMVPGRDVTLEKAERAGSLDFVLSNGRWGALEVICQWHNQGT